MTLLGPDIYNGQNGLDLSHLAEASFVFAKASEGTYYSDASYAGWRAQARQLGTPFAWYHFLTTQDPAAQVQHTLACIGDKTLPGMLDVEPQLQTGSKPTLGDITAYADIARSAGMNLRLVYLPHWYWQQIGSPDLTPLADRGLFLVSSSYPGGTGSPAALYPGDGAAGWASYGGMTPAFYQYTNQASDGGWVLDFNAFRGTRAQLLAVLGGPTTTGDTMPTPEDYAKANYNYGQEDVDLSTGVMHNVPLGNLAHGAWVSTNDPKGPVLSRLIDVQSKVDALVLPPAPPAPDVQALAAALVPVLVPMLVEAIVPHLPAVPTPDDVATAVLQHVSADTAKG